MLKSVVVAVAVAVAACGNDATEPAGDVGTQQSVQLGEEVTLQHNQSVAVRGTALRVRFVGVPADSRCPIDALCIWMGDAEVRLEITDNRAVVRQESVHTGDGPKFVVVNGIRIELLEVAPAVASDREIRPQDYSVKLRITRS